MYLKSIKAQGFKSFADKLDLEINPGITGIVGPNGSGKSNIVDAVRWVLGEQSVKSLRASSGMTDCIFSGSESREAQKRAMVALTFDNSDNYLNSEFKEVEIKRVVYASGENEYYLNNSKVRLKDIQDLFMDSGAGNGAFNIISQGNVTEIVNSKPIDRRIIFESAAGVLKYKKRKEESLKKLEKTEENIMRVNLIIDELKNTYEPLKEQAEEASKYLDIKNELESIDIALIAKDINDFNHEYKTLNVEIESLKQEIEKYSNDEINVKIEKLKLDSIKLEDDINKKREEINLLKDKINTLTSEKQITIERQKYELDSNTIDENVLKLTEDSMNISKKIDVLNNDLANKKELLNKNNTKLSDIENNLIQNKVRRSTLNNSLMEDTKNEYILKNRIEILENNILSANSAPLSVKNVLNNPRLKGIHNIISNLITVDDKYITALDVALGGSANYIVVDNENNAIEAIEYLKDKRLGRATFYPLNVIKERFITSDVINNIKSINGFIGIMADLVEYDSIYTNIIKNQLGQVILCNDAKTMNTIGKLLDYKYKVVTIDGEILNIGGSITGGSSKKYGVLNEKTELNNIKDNLIELTESINKKNNELKSLDNIINELENSINDINKDNLLINASINNIDSELKTNIDKSNEINSQLNGMKDLKNNSLSDHLLKIIEDIKELTKESEINENNLKELLSRKSSINDEVNVLEKKLRDENSKFNTINNSLKEKEIKVGKIEVKLDSLLEDLSNNYNITFELAQEKYTLDMEEDLARIKANKLKRELSKLGNVNIGAIDEYKRLSERYDFLTKQREDLASASQELKDIITQMDEIMLDKFSETFKKIQKEFSRIFTLMFKGGKGTLSLSDENNLLETGIEIEAIPPGKKINSPVLLSGGEKALTAICLLFAMLQVKPSPFVILDEAEAALDEINVDMFGKYLNIEKDKSQFIVITHKKRMMEYADTLYGVTMQESGVSKIVSAKLENLS